MKIVKIALASSWSLILLSPDTAYADEVLAQVGGWKVERSLDAMTDAPSCVAHTDGFRVQMTTDSLAVSYRGIGGVKGSTLRLDNDEPWDMRLPSDAERNISSIVLDGSEWSKIKQADRVRIRTLTVLSTLVDDDIDLSNKDEILEILNGPKCNEAANM